MAASVAKVGQVISNSSNCILQSVLFRDALGTARILTCRHQQVRERKRTCKAPSWHVRRGAAPQVDDLTKLNQLRLKQLALMEYKDMSSPLKDDPWPRENWTWGTRRTGVLAVKLGVMPQWYQNGKKIDVTLLQILDNHVIRYTPPEQFSQQAGHKPYWTKFGSVVVGALSCYPQQFTKHYNNLFLEAGVAPKRKLTRFLVTPNAAIQPGTPLTAMHFRPGDFVDASSKTIGHGFQGVVKRWGFKGGRRTHGTTKNERRTGSIGTSGDARVWPGKKMPGHMGMDWNIQRGLEILRINTKYNILYVKGKNISGPNHCYVRVYDTVLRHKRRLENDGPPMPTFYEDDMEDVEDEYCADSLYQFTSPSIKYDDQ